MKHLISYSTTWARTHSNVYKPLVKLAEELHVPIKPHSEVFKTIEHIKKVLDVTDNGFDEIVKNTCRTKIANYPFTDALRWILQNPNDRLVSVLMLIYKNDLWRIEPNLSNVKYHLKLIQNRKKT